MHYFTNNLPCLKNDRVYKLFYAKLIHDGVIKMVLKGSVWLKMRLLILFQAAFFENRKKLQAINIDILIFSPYTKGRFYKKVVVCK